MIHIFLLLFIQHIYSNTIHQSICIPNFVAVNIHSTKFNKEKEYNCYDQIKDYEKTIYAYRLKSECYIDHEMMLLDKGRIISRCGQWIQLVGPSQKKVVCMIAGSRSLKLNRNETMSSDIHKIYVSMAAFQRLTSAFTESNDFIVPITVAETEIHMKRYPRLYVIKKDMNNNIVTLQVIDSNRVVEKLVIDKIEYPTSENNQFTVPFTNKSITISLVTFDNERIDFTNINFTSNETIFRSTHQFVHNEMSQCQHLSDGNVYKSNNNKDNGYYLNWQIWLEDNNENIKRLERKKEPIIFPFETEIIKTSFVYPSPFKMNYDFAFFEMIFDINFDQNDYDHKQSNLVYHYEDTTNNSYVRHSTTIEKLPTKYFVENNGKTIHLKVALNTEINTFSNSITIIHQVKSSNKQKTIELKHAEFIRRRELQNITQCSIDSMKCFGYQCTVSSSNSLWKEGCIPQCGVCKIGYRCSSSGECILEENKNTRSKAFHDCIILIFCIVIMII